MILLLKVSKYLKPMVLNEKSPNFVHELDTELGLNLLLNCGQLYTQLRSNPYSVATKCIFNCDRGTPSYEKKKMWEFVELTLCIK